ncbi:hypothetical protein CW304_02170 [Bacillus sp. UFRGS-B20]|nr:hypothetical protein CW304_02170 [Bacillus sp. UFRGS-B20]
MDFYFWYVASLIYNHILFFPAKFCIKPILLCFPFLLLLRNAIFRRKLISNFAKRMLLSVILTTFAF